LPISRDRLLRDANEERCCLGAIGAEATNAAVKELGDAASRFAHRLARDRVRLRDLPSISFTEALSSSAADAMSRTLEDASLASQDADERARRQKLMAPEIARFSQQIETTLSDLGRISDQMLDASGKLAGAADEASTKPNRAEAASSEASSNVRDVASAAHELNASVNEIDGRSRSRTRSRARR
jgi:methyl-accepting chemotaxis protein